MGQPVTKSRFVPQIMVQSIVPSTSEVLLRIHPTSFVSVKDKSNKIKANFLILAKMLPEMLADEEGSYNV